jgi:hypothetical protein
MPRTPSAKSIAETARKIRATAERELAKALEQVKTWKAVLASLGGTAPEAEAPAPPPRRRPRRKAGRKPSRTTGGRRSLDTPILRVLAGGPLSTKAIAGRTGSSYVGTGNALKRLARAGRVKSKKAGRERIWQLASANAKPAARKARRRSTQRARKTR